MPLPATADRLEDLPEAVREFYVPTDDGRFRLDAEGVEDVAGLKSALAKEREARKALKAELAARDDGAEEPDAMADETEPETGADPEEAAADPEPASDAPAGEPDPRINALTSRLVEAEARGAVLAARGVPELLLPVLRERLTVEIDEAGAPAVRVVDTDGSALRRDDGEGFLTVADLVERLRADPVYARAFESTAKAGSGAPSAGRGEPGSLTVSAADPRAVARHIADIAAGRVRVA